MNNIKNEKDNKDEEVKNNQSNEIKTNEFISNPHDIHGSSQEKQKNSRSRSRSKTKKNKKKKHFKKRHRHRSNSSENSRYSSNKSHSRSRSFEHKDNKIKKEKKAKSKRSRSRSNSSSSRKKSNQRFKTIPEDLKESSTRKIEDTTKKFHVNSFALAGLLAETKRTNARIDKQVEESANKQFKKIDHSEREAKLLTRIINSDQSNYLKEEYEMKYQNGEYLRIHKPFQCQYNNCGMRFKLSIELTEHLDKHKRDESNLNKRMANELMRKTGKF